MRMTTETLHSQSTEHTDLNFFELNALMEAEEKKQEAAEADEVESTDKQPKHRGRRDHLESIDPKAVPVYGEASLSDVMNTREMLNAYAEKGKIVDGDVVNRVVEAMLPVTDDEDDHHYRVRQRAEIAEALFATDDQFDKIARRYTKSAARHLRSEGGRKSHSDADSTDEKVAFGDKLKQLFRSPDSSSDDTEADVPEGPTRRSVQREIKKLDRKFDGLVGEIAETGTNKSAFLAQQLETYIELMNAQKYEINDKNRLSAEREVVRKLVQPLAQVKNLEGDAAREYEDELVDTFHAYTKLSDEERLEFNDTLDARYGAVKELNALDKAQEAEKAADKPSVVERLKESKPTKSLLGGAALAAVGLKFGGNKVRQASSKLFDRDIINKSKDLYLRAAYNTGHVLDLAKSELSKRGGRKEGESDEQYERRMRRNGRNVMLGAVALIGVAVASKVGAFDSLFDGNGGSSHGSNTEKPGSHGTPLGPEIPGHDSGNDHLSRNELFDGNRGSRSLTNANAEHLKEFLSDYKVKANDDKGVWGISEKYLHSQGIKNPTVYEIDSTKDFILNNSPLTENSVLHPGDTIKLK